MSSRDIKYISYATKRVHQLVQQILTLRNIGDQRLRFYNIQRWWFLPDNSPLRRADILTMHTRWTTLIVGWLTVPCSFQRIIQIKAVVMFIRHPDVLHYFNKQLLPANPLKQSSSAIQVYYSTTKGPSREAYEVGAHLSRRNLIRLCSKFGPKKLNSWTHLLANQ